MTLLPLVTRNDAPAQGPGGLPPIRAVYQPIVDLTHRGTVGYESLVRGALGSPLATPVDLFGWAADHGRLADLDWACRIAALSGALAAPLRPGTGLFVNVEPAAFASDVPAGFTALADAVDRAGLRMVIEITERSLGADPAAVLRFADMVHERGWALAVDDVGAEPASLAMMPFLAPEVVKLDLRLIQARTTVDVARIVSAVNAHAGATGALVLAEGIETVEHEELALSMGAHLGQGWLYGRPEPLPQQADVGTLALPAAPAAAVDHTGDHLGVPWDLVSGHPAVRRARKPLLAAMSRHLEHQARGGEGATVLLGGFQQARYLTRRTAQRYADVGSSVFLAAALGVDMPREPVAGLRGQHLDAGDPLVQEWTVTVVSPHFAGALIAHDVGDCGPEMERRFDYVVTYDRPTVLRAAGYLLHRLT